MRRRFLGTPLPPPPGQPPLGTGRILHSRVEGTDSRARRLRGRDGRFRSSLWRAANPLRRIFRSGLRVWAKGELHGTQVVLEVRPHDVPFLIHDGQTFFKVVYDRMLARPSALWHRFGSSYQGQGLTLSKHFKV